MLAIKLIFRHNAKWRTTSELVIYFVVVSVIGIVDMYTTDGCVSIGSPPLLAKVTATAIGLVLNFIARRFIVFPETPRPDWKPQDSEQDLK